jgi:hypothetical protein
MSSHRPPLSGGCVGSSRPYRSVGRAAEGRCRASRWLYGVCAALHADVRWSADASAVTSFRPYFSNACLWQWELWQNLEANYRLHLAVRGERRDLASHAAWAKKFPVKAMLSRRCFAEPLDDADLVRKLLSFFGVGTVAGWQARFGATSVAYRRSPAFKAAPTAVTAWLRIGEIEAEQIECQPFDRKRFRSLFADVRA